MYCCLHGFHSHEHATVHLTHWWIGTLRRQYSWVHVHCMHTESSQLIPTPLRIIFFSQEEYSGSCFPSRGRRLQCSLVWERRFVSVNRQHILSMWADKLFAWNSQSQAQIHVWHVLHHVSFTLCQRGRAWRYKVSTYCRSCINLCHFNTYVVHCKLRE